jgi:hypothetical protein
MESNETVQKKAPQQKVWLRDEQKTAVVRRVEMHPNWGKQYLVTTHSNEWGSETYWVKEENVEPMGAHRNG